MLFSGDDPGDENDDREPGLNASHRVLWARGSIPVLWFTHRARCWYCSDTFVAEMCVEDSFVHCPLCGTKNYVPLAEEKHPK